MRELKIFDRTMLIAAIVIAALLIYLVIFMMGWIIGIEKMESLEKFMSASSGVMISLLIIAGAAFTLVFFVMFVCWLCKDEGMIILPFEVAMKEEKYNGKAISQLLTADLLRISQIHDPNVEYLGITPIEYEMLDMPELVPTSENLTYTVSQLGSMGLGTTSINIGPLITILKKLWPWGYKGQVISGSLLKYGSVLSLVACLEHKKIIAWEACCEIQRYSLKGDKGIRELTQDLSCKIIHDLNHDKISAKTWEGFKHFTEALGAYRQYNLTEAIGYLDRSRAECIKAANSEVGYKNLYELLYNLGMEYSNKREYYIAEELLLKASEIKPDDELALVGLGHLYVIQRQYEKALDKFVDATNSNPESSIAWYNKGRALFYVGNFKDSLEASEKAIALNPKNDKAWSSKGAALHKFKDFEKALEACNEAIKLNPKSAVAWSNKILTLEEMGRKDEALKIRKNAAELRLKSAAIYISLARHYRKDCDESEKEEACKLARDLIRTDPSIYNNACFEAVCGDPDAALALLRTALEKKEQTADWARRDPDFEFIRDDPRFKALLDEFSEDGEKGPE